MGYALCRWPPNIAHCFRTVEIIGIVASGSWHFWYPDLSFGMLQPASQPASQLLRSSDVEEEVFLRNNFQPYFGFQYFPIMLLELNSSQPGVSCSEYASGRNKPIGEMLNTSQIEVGNKCYRGIGCRGGNRNAEEDSLTFG